MKTGGGVNLLDPTDRIAADIFFDGLEKFGVFSIRKGELETWLEHLGIERNKTDWTVAMLERLGSDPLDGSYVKPGEDDVWEFLERVVAWIRNPARNGTA